MNRRGMLIALVACGLAITAQAPAAQKGESTGEWVSLFDGKTLGGWTTADGTPGNWKVEDGEIHGSGPASHLFSPRGDYKNFKYKAEFKIADKANSGMYFRTKKGPGFPNGYEAQVNSTHSDPVKTGSLYNHVKVFDKLVPPDTWFTQEIEAVGNHIIIKVNGKTTVDYDRQGQHPLLGPLRLPAARPGQPGLDPQGRGHGTARLAPGEGRGHLDHRQALIDPPDDSKPGPDAAGPAPPSTRNLAHEATMDPGRLAPARTRRLDWPRASPPAPSRQVVRRPAGPPSSTARRPPAGRRSRSPGKQASSWEVKDGVLEGSGGQSMLYSPKGDYQNFKFRAELKINDKGNSGMYVRTPKGATFMDGYEIQVNATHSDPIKTGSLYTLVHLEKAVVPPDTWFTQEIEVADVNYRGKMVTKFRISVNGELLFEYLDHDRLWKDGHFAFQQHDPGSKVSIRKVEVMELPPTKQPEPAKAGNRPTSQAAVLTRPRSRRSRSPEAFTRLPSRTRSQISSPARKRTRTPGWHLSARAEAEGRSPNEWGLIRHVARGHRSNRRPSLRPATIPSFDPLGGLARDEPTVCQEAPGHAPGGDEGGEPPEAGARPGRPDQPSASARSSAPGSSS